MGLVAVSLGAHKQPGWPLDDQVTCALALPFAPLHERGQPLCQRADRLSRRCGCLGTPCKVVRLLNMPGLLVCLRMCPVPRRSYCYAGNMAHLLNHSCEPNAYSRTITVRCTETGTLSDHVVIFAKHSIEAGEELTYDYRCASCPPDIMHTYVWVHSKSRLFLQDRGCRSAFALWEKQCRPLTCAQRSGP